jgi:hypothetical protein
MATINVGNSVACRTDSEMDSTPWADDRAILPQSPHDKPRKGIATRFQNVNQAFATFQSLAQGIGQPSQSAWQVPTHRAKPFVQRYAGASQCADFIRQGQELFDRDSLRRWRQFPNSGLWDKLLSISAVFY